MREKPNKEVEAILERAAMNRDDALAAVRAVERGEAPSGSVIIALTGPRSLSSPGLEPEDAQGGDMSKDYAVKYAGPSDQRFIASGTNPWVEVDGKPIKWSEQTLVSRSSEPNDCDMCGTILPGVIESMDTDEGIQRCDQCQRFDGDISAAVALAEVVGGEVWFTVERWIVRLYNNGWTVVADRFRTEEDAQTFMTMLVAHRLDGNTGLDVCHVSTMDVC